MNRTEYIDKTFIKYNADKSSIHHNYSPVYATISPYIENVLEIGVASGDSIKSWVEIFPNAEIYGVDKDPIPEELSKNPRVHTIASYIQKLDTEGLPKFDLIVDDASHDTGQIMEALTVLQYSFKGTYVVEDVKYSNACEIMQFIEQEFPSASGLSLHVTKFDGGSGIIFFSNVKA